MDLTKTYPPSSTYPRTGLLGRAVIAGIIGGMLSDVFLAVALKLPPVAIGQFVASALMGKVAFSSPSYAALGFVMHFALSIGWASVYAVIAQSRPALLGNPWLGGALFGVLVFAVMSIVLVAVHLPPDPIVLGLIAHVAFFGIPVAWWISRR